MRNRWRRDLLVQEVLNTSNTRLTVGNNWQEKAKKEQQWTQQWTMPWSTIDNTIGKRVVFSRVRSNNGDNVYCKQRHSSPQPLEAERGEPDLIFVNFLYTTKLFKPVKSTPTMHTFAKKSQKWPKRAKIGKIVEKSTPPPVVTSWQKSATYELIYVWGEHCVQALPRHESYYGFAPHPTIHLTKLFCHFPPLLQSLESRASTQLSSLWWGHRNLLISIVVLIIPVTRVSMAGR